MRFHQLACLLLIGVIAGIGCDVQMEQQPDGQPAPMEQPEYPDPNAIPEDNSLLPPDQQNPNDPFESGEPLEFGNPSEEAPGTNGTDSEPPAGISELPSEPQTNP